jgi:DNA replication protein DnaC
MTATPQSLKTVLKRLRLSGILHTLDDRIAYAKNHKLTHADFVELVLQDEIDRRDAKSLTTRIKTASIEVDQTLENFDWDAPVTFDKQRVKELFSLAFYERREDVVFLGPAGVGKTFLASALAHAVCRCGKRVIFIRADKLLKELHQSRADNSTDRVLRKFIAADVLVIDDFALRALSATQSSDIYEIILERHKRATTIMTSNRAIDEWVPLFDDPILANSAIDRFAHNAHQVIIEGDSYRKHQGPAATRART